MRRIMIALVMLFAFAGAQAGDMNKVLRYDADYHFGFIRLVAGHADININIENNTLMATLNGRSIPWHGRIYCVSDTLHASFEKSGDISLETVTYENGRYSKPKEKQLNRGRFDASYPENYKTIYGRGELEASDETMEAVTISADMLALYYYFREIDFEAMSPGKSIKIPIKLVNGDVQHVVVTYNGKDQYNDKSTYKVVFEYSYHGEMTNYPVTCQIDQDSRIPLLFSAEIKIGHIELVLK